MKDDVENEGGDIFFNGRFVGNINNPKKFISELKEKRRKNELPIESNETDQQPQKIIYNEDNNLVDAYNPAWAIYVGVTSVSVFILILLLLFFIRQRR